MREGVDIAVEVLDFGRQKLSESGACAEIATFVDSNMLSRHRPALTQSRVSDGFPQFTA